MANAENQKSESNRLISKQKCEASVIQTTQEKHIQQEESESKPAKPTTKTPPDILCNCPQKCDQRVPQNVRSILYKEFCSLGDHIRQNSYLQSYIEMRSVYKRLWSEEERIGGRLQRRVSCKYKVPMEAPKPTAGDDNELPHTIPKLTTNSKGQPTVVIGVREGSHTIEVCQKAFMNVYGITEKRIRLQREKLIARLRADNPDHYLRIGDAKSSDSATKISTSSSLANHSNVKNIQNSKLLPDHSVDDDELSIVETFFRNQLWKPEYIGITTDKLQHLDVYYNNVKA